MNYINAKLQFVTFLSVKTYINLFKIHKINLFELHKI